MTSSGMVFEDKISSRPYLTLPVLTDNEFIDLLRCMSERVIPEKEAARLVTPAVFDADLSPDTDRGLANIAYLRGVWLDNDGGDLTKEEFARLLPRLRMVIYNTYRSRPGAERWRVFIPTDWAMPLEVHRNILNALITDTTPSASTREMRKAEALQRWEEVSRTPGQGHVELFRLGVGLKRAGLDDTEIRAELMRAALTARNPSERRGEIKDVMRSLLREVRH